MQPSLTINPSAAFAAFDDWARLQRIRGKTAEQTLKKVMKFWISFALFKIQAADPADIEASLMRLTTSYSRLSSRDRHRKRSAAIADKYRVTACPASPQMDWQRIEAERH